MNRHVSIAIVGAPKAATTSMLRYLGQHPLLHAHPQAECDYFLNDEEYQRGWPAAYERYFAKDPGAPVQLVCKRALMLYDAASLERLAQHNPSVVVTALLRDPVGRAFSAYQYAKLRGWQAPISFEEAIAPELADGPFLEADRHGAGGYLSTGVYVWHVRRLLEIVPRSQVFIFTTDEVADDGATVWRTLFSAVGVDEAFTPQYEVRHNVAAEPRSARLARALASTSGAVGLFRRVASDRMLDRARRIAAAVIDRPVQSGAMDPGTRATLEAFYRPFNAELAELLGRTNPWG